MIADMNWDKQCQSAFGGWNELNLDQSRSKLLCCLFAIRTVTGPHVCSPETGEFKPKVEKCLLAMWHILAGQTKAPDPWLPSVIALNKNYHSFADKLDHMTLHNQNQMIRLNSTKIAAAVVFKAHTYKKHLVPCIICPNENNYVLIMQLHNTHAMLEYPYLNCSTHFVLFGLCKSMKLKCHELHDTRPELWR